MSWYAADKMYRLIYCLPIGLSVVLLVLLLYLWAAARTRLCGGGKRRIWQTAAALLLSMGIEWTQYTCRLGAAETDDVLFNTLGALTGMLQGCDFGFLRSCRGKAQTGAERAEN